MEHESDGDTNCNSHTQYGHERIVTGTGEFGNKKIIRTNPLLRSVRILRKVLETWGDLLSFKLQWETIH